jgi:hypothetical protein
MGMAWKANNQFPWEVARYVGGIENVKINVTLRIYSNKWHVYAGLAILNPSAKEQIRQYADSVTKLFKLMLRGDRAGLQERVAAAGAAVFGSMKPDEELLLRDAVLDRFSLGRIPHEKAPNNHLSLLAMVDSWWKLGINPYEHIICSTPVSFFLPSPFCAPLPFFISFVSLLVHGEEGDIAVLSLSFMAHYAWGKGNSLSGQKQLFRLWLGATEYLFRKPSLLQEVICTAIEDATFRSDDLEFTFAARVSVGAFLSFHYLQAFT